MTRVVRVDPSAVGASSPQIREVASILLSGGLALLPTETVYGVGVAVNAFEAQAEPADAHVNGLSVPAAGTGYRRIFDLKQRDLAQTVPWLVSGPEDLDVYGESVDPRIRALARSFWPGALTLVVPASDRVPAYMRAPDGTVALRASSSPVISALVHACGCPLATTSANTHGKPAPSEFAEAERRIVDGVDIAIDAGVTACRDASTIVAIRSGALKIIRQGALPASEIERALADAGGAPRV